MANEIILSTQDFLGDFDVTKTLGIVRGNTVRSRNLARNIMASLRTIAGGEIPEWTKIVTQTRDQALERLQAHAKEMGADAVVGLRIITTEVGQSASEVLAYGTAVKLQTKKSG